MKNRGAFIAGVGSRHWLLDAPRHHVQLHNVPLPSPAAAISHAPFFTERYTTNGFTHRVLRPRGRRKDTDGVSGLKPEGGASRRARSPCGFSSPSSRVWLLGHEKRRVLCQTDRAAPHSNVNDDTPRRVCCEERSRGLLFGSVENRKVASRSMKRLHALCQLPSPPTRPPPEASAAYRAATGATMGGVPGCRAALDTQGTRKATLVISRLQSAVVQSRSQSPASLPPVNDAGSHCLLLNLPR